MIYKYYVVYLEYKDGIPLKIAHGEITLKNKIRCEEDITNITNTLIKYGEGIDYAMVLNYILMDEIEMGEMENENRKD